MATIVHIGDTEHVIERMPLRVLVNFERSHKGRSPKGIEDMAWCAHQALRRQGVDVPEDLDAFIATVDGIEIDVDEDDDEEGPTEPGQRPG